MSPPGQGRCETCQELVAVQLQDLVHLGALHQDALHPAGVGHQQDEAVADHAESDVHHTLRSSCSPPTPCRPRRLRDWSRGCANAGARCCQASPHNGQALHGLHEGRSLFVSCFACRRCSHHASPPTSLLAALCAALRASFSEKDSSCSCSTSRRMHSRPSGTASRDAYPDGAPAAVPAVGLVTSVRWKTGWGGPPRQLEPPTTRSARQWQPTSTGAGPAAAVRASTARREGLVLCVRAVRGE